MNDFDSTLSAALQAEAERTTLTLDAVDAARRLEIGLDQIDRKRRGRAWGAGLAVAAVLAIAIVRAVGQNQPTTPEPIGPSPDVPGGELVAQHPFLLDHFDPYWHVARQEGARPPRLTHCVDDPRTWGAVRTQAATYIDPHPSVHNDPPSVRVNEYLLQYRDAPVAHRALLRAFHQLKGCPLPDGGFEDPLRLQEGPGYPPGDFDEFFAQQRDWSNGLHLYVLRVARAGNVLVVLEDTGIPSDRSPSIMTRAVVQALPNFK